MSHFSVCVALPAMADGKKLDRDGIYDALERVMEKYYEGSEDPHHLTFEDKTEEVTARYETETMQVVHMPDGSVERPYSRPFSDKYLLDNGKVYLRNPAYPVERIESDETRAMWIDSNYPAKKLCSFREFCSDYFGYTQLPSGAWGYYHNPNAKWDWWEIGGRFAGPFLVRRELKDCIACEGNAAEVIRDFVTVNAARKKDICWDEMKRLKEEASERTYELLKQAYAEHDSSKLKPLSVITDDGIRGWSDVLLYKAGETYEEYRNRKGVAEDDAYMLDSYAYVDLTGEWHSEGDMCFFGISVNNKEERNWHDELQEFMSGVGDDDYLVMVDCHI